MLIVPSDCVTRAIRRFLVEPARPPAIADLSPLVGERESRRVSCSPSHSDAGLILLSLPLARASSLESAGNASPRPIWLTANSLDYFSEFSTASAGNFALSSRRQDFPQQNA